MMRRSAWFMVALSMLLLTACGGDSQSDAQQGAESFVSMMSAEVSPMSTSASTTVTAEMTMDWAEREFPELFPRETAFLFPVIEYEGVTYNARAYVGAWGDRYLGITQDGRIFGMGDFTGGKLQQFETIDHWKDQVLTSLKDGENRIQDHLTIGVPFYNVFFEGGEWKIITVELTSNTALNATFDGNTYTGSWVMIDDDIVNIAVTGQDPGYFKLIGVEEKRLNVCYSDSLSEMDVCDEYFYFNLADAQAHGQSSGTVTSLTGRVWMDRNLGASRVATAYNDPAAYGDLYQWGRGTDGHEKLTSPTTTTLSFSDTPELGHFIVAPASPFDWRVPKNDNLWQGVSGINNPCPPGFRLPIISEWEAERATWSSNDKAGAFASPLKLVLAGGRNTHDGAISVAGSAGIYGSSSVNGVGARGLYFDSGNASTYSGSRAGGASVRCIED